MALCQCTTISALGPRLGHARPRSSRKGRTVAAKGGWLSSREFWCHGSGYEIAFGSPKLIASGSAKEIAVRSAKLILATFGSAKESVAGSAKLSGDHWTDVSVAADAAA